MHACTHACGANVTRYSMAKCNNNALTNQTKQQTIKHLILLHWAEIKQVFSLNTTKLVEFKPI